MKKTSHRHGMAIGANVPKRKSLPDWRLVAAKGGVVRLLTLPLAAVCAVLTARLTIEATGVYTYGYVNAIATLFLLIPFADLGIGTAVTNAVATAGLKNDNQISIEQTVVSAVRKLVLIAALFSFIIGVATGAKLLGILLGVPDQIMVNDQWVLAVPFMVYFISLPAGLGYRMLVGLGRSDVLATIGLIGPVSTLLFTFLLSRFIVGPFWFSVGPPLGLLATSIAASIVATRLLNLRLRSIARNTISLRKVPSTPIMDVAWPMLVISSAFAVLLHSHKLLLAHLSDPRDLASYALAMQLFLPAWSVVHMSGTVLWSEFSKSNRKYALWKQANILVLAVSILGGATLVVLGPYVIRLMEPSATLNALPVLLAFSVLMTVLGMDLTQNMLLVSAPDLKYRAAWAVTALAVYGSCATKIAESWGAVGLVLFTAGVIFFVQSLPNAVRSWRLLRSL